MNFTYESDSCGYRIFCDGKPIGGATTQGTATHTSDGRRRSPQTTRKDAREHNDVAAWLCQELADGRGPAYLRKHIPA